MKLKRIGPGCYSGETKDYHVAVERMTKEQGDHTGYHDVGWMWSLSPKFGGWYDHADYAVPTKRDAVTLLKQRLEMDA